MIQNKPRKIIELKRNPTVVEAYIDAPNWVYSKAHIQGLKRKAKIQASTPKDLWKPKQRGKSCSKNTNLECQFLLQAQGIHYWNSLKYYCAGNISCPESFRASIIFSDARCIGLDFHAVANKHRYNKSKTRPSGWHENIIYFDARQKKHFNAHYWVREDSNFPPSDLLDFHNILCEHWAIETTQEQDNHLPPLLPLYGSPERST